MNNSEQHEYLCLILAKLVPVLDCEELSLLAHCCGVQISEFYGNQPDFLIDEPELIGHLEEA
jgi:hypothetical protein